MLTLDPTKSVPALQMSLAKSGVTKLPQVEVAFDLDVSGSYDDEHRDGSTNDIMTRLIPWGMLLDPDKKLDVFTFSNGERHAHYVGDVTDQTYRDYVRRNIINKVPGYNGGTDYAHVIRKNLAHFGWISGAEAPKKSGGGFFGFGRKSEPTPSSAPAGAQRKSLIIFNTDGDNSDKRETRELFEEMQRNNYGVYVMFVAVSNQGGGFPFIQKLADDFDNCGITVVRDVRRWTQLSDEELNQQLITDELVAWFNA